MRIWLTTLTTLFVITGVTAPAQAQTQEPACGYFDSGLIRPPSRPDPRPDCSGATTSSLGTFAPGGSLSPHAVGPLSFSTIFAADNSFAGNTFDIVTGASAILINGFDVNLDPTGTDTTMAIYWRPGTADGFQADSTGWTLLGTDVVTPAGLNNPTHVDVGGLVLSAATTYGFYVDTQSYPSSSLQYSNGGPTDFAGPDFTITTRHGKGNPAFTGADFFPRQWNGTVHYALTTGVPTMPTVMLLVLAALLLATVLVAQRHRQMA